MYEVCNVYAMMTMMMTEPEAHTMTQQLDKKPKHSHTRTRSKATVRIKRTTLLKDPIQYSISIIHRLAQHTAQPGFILL